MIKTKKGFFRHYLLCDNCLKEIGYTPKLGSKNYFCSRKCAIKYGCFEKQKKELPDAKTRRKKITAGYRKVYK